MHTAHVAHVGAGVLEEKGQVSQLIGRQVISQGLTVLPGDGVDDGIAVCVAHDGVGGDGHAVLSVAGADGTADPVNDLGLRRSVAVGMALGGKLDKADYRVYAILGDGEIEEGQVWEAAMLAGNKGLDNLVAIVDNNNLQIDGTMEEVNSPYPIPDKFRAFNWNTVEIDGHDFDQIEDAFAKAKQCKGKPTAIIMKTIKGKGVSFMENAVGWHGSAPNTEQYEQAMEELKAALAKLEA